MDHYFVQLCFKTWCSKPTVKPKQRIEKTTRHDRTTSATEPRKVKDEEILGRRKVGERESHWLLSVVTLRAPRRIGVHAPTSWNGRRGHMHWRQVQVISLSSRAHLFLEWRRIFIQSLEIVSSTYLSKRNRMKEKWIKYEKLKISSRLHGTLKQFFFYVGSVASIICSIWDVPVQFIYISWI